MENNNWFKKHTDTVLVLGGILAAVLWINGQFNSLKKDIAIVKTVLIMPTELAKEEKK